MKDSINLLIIDEGTLYTEGNTCGVTDTSGIKINSDNDYINISHHLSNGSKA